LNLAVLCDKGRRKGLGIESMKNDECTIYIRTRGGSTQTYRREGDGWVQTSSKGTRRQLSAEQLLSHMLPILAGVSLAILEVIPDERLEKT